MNMLRSFVYQPSLDVVLETLGRFDLTLPEYIAMVRFEVISPDSFMWRLLIGNDVYYLYAEDYIPGLDYVRLVFGQYIEDDEWSFVKPKTIIEFDDSTSVRSAITYQKPEDSDEMMQYAVNSGHDLVFLARSSEDSDDAQFSNLAPRGFTPSS